MIPVEKPGSPQELIHFGKKGMKWGVRKNQIGDSVLAKGFGITTTGSRERAAVKTNKSQTRVGVRNAYLDSATSRGARYRRVGEGKGRTGDSLKTHITTSNLSLIRAKKAGRPGFKGAAMERALRTEGHVARMKKGEATAHDILRMSASITMSDIVKGLEKRR